LDIGIYPNEGFRVKGKNYEANWSCFVVDLELISDPDRFRRTTLSFGAPSVPPVGQKVVQASREEVWRYRRSVTVAAWVISRALGKCEACGDDAPFLDVDGKPFLEIHHLKPLAEGGPDTPDNTIAVCPNCHRALHQVKVHQCGGAT
jgi:hypothetical protein